MASKVWERGYPPANSIFPKCTHALPQKYDREDTHLLSSQSVRKITQNLKASPSFETQKKTTQKQIFLSLKNLILTDHEDKSPVRDASPPPLPPLFLPKVYACLIAWRNPSAEKDTHLLGQLKSGLLCETPVLRLCLHSASASPTRWLVAAWPPPQFFAAPLRCRCYKQDRLCREYGKENAMVF